MNSFRQLFPDISLIFSKTPDSCRQCHFGPVHYTLATNSTMSATKSTELATVWTVTRCRIQVVADLSPQPATESTVLATELTVSATKSTVLATELTVSATKSSVLATELTVSATKSSVSATVDFVASFGDSQLCRQCVLGFSQPANPTHQAQLTRR